MGYFDLLLFHNSRANHDIKDPAFCSDYSGQVFLHTAFAQSEFAVSVEITMKCGKWMWG